jgi:hypothetical protein
MNVLECHHVPELLLPVRVKPALYFFPGVLERAEHPIEHRQVRVIVCVPLVLMMHAV